MPINIVRWKPDTCGCEFEFTWDTNTTERNRTHTFHKVIKACPSHETLVQSGGSVETAKIVYDTVVSENSLKNKALQKAIEVNPEFADFIEPESGNRIDAKSFIDQVASPTSVRSSSPASSSDPLKIMERYNLGLTLKEDVNYEWNWIEPVVIEPNKPRTLEINFRVPKIIEVLNPERVTRTKNAKSTLQLELDKEFHGRIKVRT